MATSKLVTGIKPSRFNSLSDIAIPEEVKVEEKINDRSEELLHGLFYHDGWEVLHKSILDQITLMEELAKDQIKTGAPWEEIGKTAVILQICKEELLKVINRVTDAKEAIESRDADRESGNTDNS